MELAADSASQAESLQHTSRPMSAVREDLSQRTLGEALEDLLPEYFEVGSRDNSNIGETASVSATPAAANEDRQAQVGLKRSQELSVHIALTCPGKVEVECLGTGDEALQNSF